MYNTKHGYVSYLIFILVTARGRIVYASNEAVPGGIHDRSHWDSSSAVASLTEFYSAVDRRSHTLCISGDKAYPNISLPPQWKVIITQSGQSVEEDKDDLPENGNEAVVNQADAEDDTIIFDTEISQFRSVVERVIWRLKGYAILQSEWVTSQEKAAQYTHIASALTNFIVLDNDIDV